MAAEALEPEAGLLADADPIGFVDRCPTWPARANVLDRIKDQIPLGRLGEPEEVARVVRHLTALNGLRRPRRRA